MKPYKDSEPCQCFICQMFCKRPCWPTPADVRKLIDRGYAKRLMLDWGIDENDQRYGVLCGASKGYEGRIAPLDPITPDGCTFHVNWACQLHRKKLKPMEGRVARHDFDHNQAVAMHQEIGALWDSEEGRALVEEWRKIVHCTTDINFRQFRKRGA